METLIMQLSRIRGAKGASPVAQTVSNPPEMQEIWIQSLGWEDPLEKEMATHSSILALRIPWTEESGRLQSMGFQEPHGWVTNSSQLVTIEGRKCKRKM